MPTYLTQCGMWAGVNIEADSLVDAEYILREMIERLEVPPDTEIIGEEVETIEWTTNCSKPNSTISQSN